MYENLNHLTNEQIDALINRYYNNEKIASLLQEYGLTVRPSSLYKLFPERKLQATCPYCNEALYERYSARGSYGRKAGIKCSSCGHVAGGYCWCTGCKQLEQKQKEEASNRKCLEEEKKRETLNSILTQSADNPVDLATLTFKEKIYLGALLREGISEDFSYIFPIEKFTNPLAPTLNYQTEIINLLYKRRILALHPDNDISLFPEIDVNGGKVSFYTSKVKWSLNISDGTVAKVPLVNSIINPTEEGASNDALVLWKEIAFHECLEYLLHSIRKVMGIEYSAKEKTFTIIEDLLNHYSVSQVYNLFYRSINNALRFQREKGVSMTHAANTVIGNAHNFAERARVEKWELKKYSRERDCPESALSKFFFERVIKIGYSGFNDVPVLVDTAGS